METGTSSFGSSLRVIMRVAVPSVITYIRVPVLRSVFQGHNLLNKCALRK
jgi:hypothetical protein